MIPAAAPRDNPLLIFEFFGKLLPGIASGLSLFSSEELGTGATLEEDDDEIVPIVCVADSEVEFRNVASLRVRAQILTASYPPPGNKISHDCNASQCAVVFKIEFRQIKTQNQKNGFMKE